MLQRAASNAYSWWWASHIRTKQSKWMEQNLQDMEEKVQAVLKLLQEEGDSFKKKAEMYYKRRPELIIFVEESFRAYRSLADRYDHLSTELQNANNTIASVCPDRVPYMDEDDDDGSPRTPRKMPGGFKPNLPFMSNDSNVSNVPNVPKVPKPPLKDLKSVITTATKKLSDKKASTTASKAPKSGLSRKEAIEEVDKLQKQILALQTVKEFLKSSYDNSIAKYWETEGQITSLQERVSNLQDELGEGVVNVIDDEDARRLMAQQALKSCQDALAQLQEKQAVSLDETKIESKRVKEVREKLSSFMNQLEYNQTDQQKPRPKRDVKEVIASKDLSEDIDETMTQQRQELQLLQEKIKEHFEADSCSGLSVTEMAEKIDELVTKVISLESSVSSQTALVKNLKDETDELHSLIRILETEKESLINDKVKLNEKLREMDEKMVELQDLSQVAQDQNNNLQTHFTEAHCSLDNLSEKVQMKKPDEEAVVSEISQTEKNSSREDEPKHAVKAQDALNQDKDLLKDEAKSNKATSLVEDDPKQDVKAQDAMNQDKDILKDDPKSNKATSLAEDEPKNEVKAQDGFFSFFLKKKDTSNDDAKSNKATSLAEDEPKQAQDVLNQDKALLNDDAKSNKATSREEDILNPDTENKAKVTGSQTKEEPTSVETKSSVELKEREKTHDISSSNQIKSIDAGNHENDSKEISSETKSTSKGDFDEEAITREKNALLLEYTNTLRNYEEMKSKLTELEKKSQDALFESSLQLKELKTSNAVKDEEIRLLRQKLSILQKSLEGKEEMRELPLPQPPENNVMEAMLKLEEEEETISAVEQKFRMGIDELLEENLEFWMRFSASFTEIQKYEATTKDLLAEVKRIEEKCKSNEGSSSVKYTLKSDARPLYKHLSEIQNELTMWLENSAMLKEELQQRFSSLCEIQEEITTALKTSAEDDDIKFTSYNAAKFQGEVLNMKQENHKVADELQSGLDLVTTLQLDAERALAKLNERFGLSNSKRSQTRSSDPKNNVPLRSFIFGVKPKKQKQSIFSCMTPAMNKKYRATK
ncbi:protein NETWORKED 2D-like [Trifolium pratense]|uniref:protein NETWORKED 2D-like n=1 Tax=Trifolium pratense TaxID=57577 RepID=UPI001E69650D|nr:protein NETWORKED 2D-like [Trifolium pratense]